MEKNVKEEKQKKGRRTLKIIMIIIVILIVVLVIHTIRNFVIITNLQNKVAEYTDNQNYSIFITSEMEDGMILTTKKYKKGNKEVILLERNMNNEIVKLSIYNNGERIDRFVETSNSKTVTLNISDYASVNIVGHLKTESIWQKILYSIIKKIKSTDYNGSKCYIVSNFLLPYCLQDKGEVFYIEKDTGLCLLIDTGSQQDQFKYEFNNVDDSIFIEPDISQYKMQEKE